MLLLLFLTLQLSSRNDLDILWNILKHFCTEAIDEWSRENQARRAAERRFFNRIFQGNEAFIRTGKIAGMQLIQVTGSAVRRQSKNSDGEYKLTFVIFYLNQRHALIEFLREAKRGWDVHRVNENDSGFESTLLNRHFTAWVTEHLEGWFHKVGGIFAAVSKTLDLMVGAHSGDVTGKNYLDYYFLCFFASNVIVLCLTKRCRWRRSADALSSLARV